MAGKLEGRSGDASGKDFRSGAHHGDDATVRSGMWAARPRIVDGEPVRRSTVGGSKPCSLRTVRGMRRG
jgi:hypothetical protein